jgi:TPR repeat protein
MATYKERAHEAGVPPLTRVRMLFDEGEDDSAVELLAPMAAGGLARAQAMLGWAYENGRGVEQDDGRAETWYQASASQDDPVGIYYLGRLCERMGEVGAAHEMYERAAELEFMPAFFRLGLLAQSDDEKIRLFEEATRRGHVPSSIRIAGLRFRKTRNPFRKFVLLVKVFGDLVTVYRIYRERRTLTDDRLIR